MIFMFHIDLNTHAEVDLKTQQTSPTPNYIN